MGETISATGRIAAWRISHGFLQDSEESVLSNLAASEEPFQPEDSGLQIVSIKAGTVVAIINVTYANSKYT